MFTKFLLHVAYVRRSVLFRHADDRPHRLSAGRGDGSAQRGRSVIDDCHFMVANHYTFMLLFVLYYFFFFPRLISAAADWMSAILAHMVWP